MSAAHERKRRVLSFADVAALSAPPASDVAEYDQLSFEGLAPVESTAVTIENLAVSKPPQLKKVQDRLSWSCTVSYQPDLWHQEGYTDFVLHAEKNAQAAIALRLKMGDVVQVTGVTWDQRLDLRGGKTKVMHHLNVMDMAIQKRAPAQTRRSR